MGPKEEFYLTEEAAEWIGLKKSESLSRLIMQMQEDDFGFEEFHRFDHLIPGTLEKPDRSYQNAGDTFRMLVFVKTYFEGETFHQVVVAASLPDQNSKAEVLVPVLTFITRKEDVVKQWTTGEPLARPTLS